MNQKTLLIVVVGPATGLALCKRLAGQYRLALVARKPDLIARLADELPDTKAYVGDIGDRASWPATLSQIVEDLGCPDRVLINTESAAWGEYHQLALDKFASSFDVNATGLLQTIQTLFPDPAEIKVGTRLMISSSPAAYNPPPRMLGLSPSRVAQRVMAESLNELLKDAGLRFSVFSIDGAIDEVNMRTMFPNKPDSYFIQPDDIAAEMHRVLESDDFPLHGGISVESSFARN